MSYDGEKVFRSLVKYIQSHQASTTISKPLQPHITRYQRPIPLGVSGGTTVGVSRSDRYVICCGGTLGSLVTKNNRYYILSNYHVLNPSLDRSQVGDLVIQPGPLDSQCNITDDSVVAKLSEWEPIRPSTNELIRPPNRIDASLAEIIPDKVRTDGYIEGLGIISTSIVEPMLGMRVVKSGRTTGITYGIIEGIDVNVIVSYDKECGGTDTYEAYFTNQILIKPDTNRNATFSLPGDSGSLVLTEDGLSPVGLLFAGSGNLSQANRIDDVINRFGVEFVGTPKVVRANNAITDPELLKVLEVKRMYLPIFLSLCKVKGVYVTKREKYHIVVMVDRMNLEDSHRIPQEVGGYQVEIIEVGKVKFLGYHNATISDH